MITISFRTENLVGLIKKDRGKGVLSGVIF